MNTKTSTEGNGNRRAMVAVIETTSLERTTQTAAALPLPNLPDGPELWRLYQQQSSIDAENALIECYLPLVGAIMNRLAGTLPEAVDREDLYSAGLLGLLTALRKFNPTIGVPFDSYARQRIRGAMLDEIRHMDWVPRAIRAKSKDFQNVSGRLEQELGRSPTRTESARAMNLTAAEYDEMLQEICPAHFIRLDSSPAHDPESETCLGEAIARPDQINPFDQVVSSELKQVILKKLTQLPKIQQQVLTLYYLEGLYLHEIATALKLTAGRICQIQSQAIQYLRAYLKRYENGIADSAPATTPRPPARNQKPAVRDQEKAAAMTISTRRSIL